MAMRLGLIIAIALVVQAVLFGQTAEEVRHEGSWSGPTFDRGYVIDWERRHEMGAYTLYAPDGTKLYSTSPSQLGFVKTLFEGLAADTDGTVAAIRHIFDPWQLEGTILLIDSSGKPGLTIHTGAHLPTRICFANDHSIWTVGYEYGKDDFLVFHHFSRDGQQLGAFVEWSDIACGFNAMSTLQGKVGGGWTLRVSKDRLGLSVPSGFLKEKWIEVSLSGNLIGQWEWDFDRSLNFGPVAFTASNVLYAQVWNYERPIGYAIFDRNTKTWKKVKGYPKGRLLGADQDDLVFSEEDGGWTILHRIPSGAVHIISGKRAQQFEPREH
ncbi:MAG: hypothetical protein JOY62_10185 [Acidobacteriaceae bacterium]|nr:hypothetical protein [Acidobacteriaceae bacterium]